MIDRRFHRGNQPQEPGWYWMKEDDSALPEVVRVRRRRIGVSLEFAFVDQLGYGPVTITHLWGPRVADLEGVE